MLMMSRTPPVLVGTHSRVCLQLPSKLGVDTKAVVHHVSLAGASEDVP